MRLVGIGGTFRKDSFSMGLLKAVKELLPEGTTFEILDFRDFPPYNPDIEIPEEIKIFKDKIKQSDAVLFSTAEYNYSVPGNLKNAIDWASRPYGDNSFEDKPAAIISESTGQLGGSRAQYHLRQIMVFLNMHPINKPEAIVPFAQEKFDEDGKLTDEKTREKIKELLEELVKWSERLSI